MEKRIDGILISMVGVVVLFLGIVIVLDLNLPALFVGGTLIFDSILVIIIGIKCTRVI